MRAASLDKLPRHVDFRISSIFLVAEICHYMDATAKLAYKGVINIIAATARNTKRKLVVWGLKAKNLCFFPGIPAF